MSWYWDDDYDDEYEERKVTADAIVLEGPVSAKSRRGPIGETWWGEQWVAAMQRLGDARLGRGKSYARNERVKDLTIQHGMTFAKVQGSRHKPYQSSFELKTFSHKVWEKALDALAEQAIYAAKLLAGEMPGDIEGIFQSIGLSLFPRSRNDIFFECSCPDWGDPCKHCAAIYYLVAEQLDADPFILFHLRGYTREHVLEGLRRRRGRGTEVEPEPEQAVESAGTPLDADLEAFWRMRSEPPRLSVPAIPSQPPALARLGEPPDDVGSDLKKMYRHISERALIWLEDDAQVENLPPLEEAIEYFSQPSTLPPWNLDMREIPLHPDRKQRFEGILVDAYGPPEELAAMEVYVQEALTPPFDALWRDPDEPGHEEPVTVLRVYGSDDRRGVLLNVKRGKKERRLVAEQVWAVDKNGTNATVLDDYRYWVDHYGGPMEFDQGW